MILIVIRAIFQTYLNLLVSLSIAGPAPLAESQPGLQLELSVRTAQLVSERPDENWALEHAALLGRTSLGV